MDKSKPLFSVQNIHKKFTTDIKYNLYYGLKDLLYDMLGLSYDYTTLRKKEFWAISDVSFDLYEGEILGVAGSNGSGKTTLMRLISGIFPIEIGEVYKKEDIKITPIFAIRAGMQLLFTGRENIYIKGAMYGMKEEEIDTQLEFIKEFSGLGDQLDMPLGNYSSGMVARLAFSIALATEPNLFIIDEALAVGDSVFKVKCFDYLINYVKKPGKSVIFVSNNIGKILKVATRVMVMDKGELICKSEDIPTALNFYIANCLKHLGPAQRKREMKKIQKYDMQ